MDEHPDATWTANVGISRRTLLRRGAVVGGALLWTTPIVQSIPHPAFAAGSPPPDGKAISYVAVVITCADGRTLRAKVNTEEGATWESAPGPPRDKASASCYPPGYFDAATESVNGGGLGLMLIIHPLDPSKATLSVPGILTGLGGDDCVVVRVDASAKGGEDCVSGSATNVPFAIEFDL